LIILKVAAKEPAENEAVRRIGVRLGNWLAVDQSKNFLFKSRGEDLRSKRNCAMLALLVGCGLRRGELLALNVRSIEIREEHWVVADLHGKAGHIRTIPIPMRVKAAINEWTAVSGITEGCLFRAIKLGSDHNMRYPTRSATIGSIRDARRAGR
jgi:site-specific recombinase XerC